MGGTPDLAHPPLSGPLLARGEGSRVTRFSSEVCKGLAEPGWKQSPPLGLGRGPALVPRWGAWTGLGARKPLEEAATSEPRLGPGEVLPLGKVQLGQGCGLPWGGGGAGGAVGRLRVWRPGQCMLPSTSVGRVGPLCCSLEGKESRPGARERQGQAGAQGQGLWVSPGLGQGAGVRCGAVGALLEAVPSLPGTREERERPGCRKLLASWPGDGAPWVVTAQLDEPPGEAAGLGPTGSWAEARKAQQPQPTADGARELRRPGEAERTQL